MTAFSSSDTFSLRSELLKLVPHANQKFTAMLNPGVENVLGLRVPDIRRLACKEVANAGWRQRLDTLKHHYMEERMLHGMMIGYAKDLELSERLCLLQRFIPLINSWSVCDSVCATLTFAKHHQEEVWTFLQPYLYADEEYEVRFALVMLLDYYLTPAYLDRIFDCLNRIHHEGYYVKMAVAWLLSVSYIRYKDETCRFLSHNKLDAFTQNKAVQKIRESYRVSQADKECVLKFKRGCSMA